MLDVGGFVTSQEFLTQVATFVTALLTQLIQALLLGGLGV